MTGDLERSLEPSPSPPPTLLRAAIFRLAFVYWGLFCIVNLCTNAFLPSWLGRPFGAFAVWVGKSILGISYEFSAAETGSGDKTSDWVLFLSLLVISLIAAIVWAALDRRRAHDPALRRLIQVMVRYSLALSVIGYGIGKLFLGQFPAPSVSRLTERIGDASPMGLMWTFMGASPAYVFFSGAAETLGSLLLLFRRTTTLGALVLVTVMTNVFMMNLCYDVPVKLYSGHYLAMAIFLLVPDLRRLANVLVLHRAVQPVAYDLTLPKRWMRVARYVVKYGVIVAALGMSVIPGVQQLVQRDGPAPWYAGHWSATVFKLDGRELPDTSTETRRWVRIVFQVSGDELHARWALEGGAYGDLYDAVFDEQTQTIALTFNKRYNGDKQPKPGLDAIQLHFTRVDADHLSVDGRIAGEALSIQLERMTANNMRLTARGFRWISEAPFNR